MALLRHGATPGHRDRPISHTACPGAGRNQLRTSPGAEGAFHGWTPAFAGVATARGKRPCQPLPSPGSGTPPSPAPNLAVPAKAGTHPEMPPTPRMPALPQSLPSSPPGSTRGSAMPPRRKGAVSPQRSRMAIPTNSPLPHPAQPSTQSRCPGESRDPSRDAAHPQDARPVPILPQCSRMHRRWPGQARP